MSRYPGGILSCALLLGLASAAQAQLTIGNPYTGQGVSIGRGGIFVNPGVNYGPGFTQPGFSPYGGQFAPQPGFSPYYGAARGYVAPGTVTYSSGYRGYTTPMYAQPGLGPIRQPIGGFGVSPYARPRGGPAYRGGLFRSNPFRGPGRIW